MYWFYKLKRERPWDYLFFDWTTFLILLLIFVTGLLTFFPSKISINIPNKDTQIYILEAILRNISQFIGISFSFILLSFNIFFRYFGRYAFLDFFKTRSARVCLTLLVCTIGILIYSTAYIRNLEKADLFNQFLYSLSILLSVVSFFSVFPCLMLLLQNSQNRENIKRLFKRLNENWLIEEFHARVIDKALHRFYHKDPISILNEIGLSAIKEFDNKTVLVITTTCPDFFASNLKLYAEEKSSIDNLTLYDEFTTLLSNLFQLSVKERNETASMMILGARFRLEEHVLNNLTTKGFENFTDHERVYKHWRLNFDIADFFKRAMQFNEDDICKRIIDKYGDFVVKAISILFPKDFRYSKELHFKAAMEADMIFEPLRAINELTSTIILNKKSHLFQAIFTLYYKVEQAVLELETPDNVKCFLLNVIFNYKYDVFNQYVDLPEVQHISGLNFPFSWTVQTFKNTGCATPHLGFLQVMNLLFAKNKLNTVVINNQKAEMLHLVKLIDERDEAKTLLLKSINKFSEIAARVTKTDSDYRKDTYLKLERYLRIVYEVAVDKNVTDAEVMETFKSALSSFENKEEFKTELKNKGFVSDDRIT